MKIGIRIDCSDLYDKAAESLKKLDNDIDKSIQDLAKMVEARGVPKNKVARQVVKELTARGVLSPSRIYEGLGIEHKRKYKKRKTEETFPQVENIFTEEKARLISENEELKRQLVEKTEQISEVNREMEDLKKKTQSDLLRELQERFYDKPGMLDAKQLQKLSEKAGRDLETVLQRYNTIIQNAVKLGQPVPLGSYVITKPDMILVPVRIMIYFDKRKIKLSLWEKKLQKPSPSVSTSFDASKVRF